MKGDLGGAVLITVFTICLGSSLALAEQVTEDARTKLNSLRREIEQVEYDHEQEVQKANKECEDKVEAARKEFHASRNKYMQERNDTLTGLNQVYKDKMKPMEAEEKDLLQQVTPASSNFAKTKSR